MGGSDDLDDFSADSVRAINGYWSWRKDRLLAERGAVQDILLSAGFEVAELRSRPAGQDPPDCEGVVNGVAAGIEVTELIHQKALERSLAGRRSLFVWDQRTFQVALQRIIDRKSSGHWKGGPYGQQILVIHTDEFMLNKSDVEAFLQAQFFAAGIFSIIVLGLSYDPRSQKCPAFRLPLRNP